MSQPDPACLTSPRADAPAEPPRSGWQFSLRTLFILVTLLVIPLAWLASGPERQRWAANQIRAAGGAVYYKIDETNIDPVPKAGWLPIDYCYRAIGIKMNTSPKSLELLELLDAFPQLEGLSLPSSIESKQFSLAALSKAPNLKALELDNNPVSDENLQALLACPELKELSLADTSISDAGLAHLANHTHLEELNLSHTHVTNDGLKHLANMQKLRILFLAATKVDDSGVVHLLRLKSLQTIYLDVTGLTDAGLAELVKLPDLFDVGVSQTKVTAAAFARWSEVAAKRAKRFP